MRRIAIIFIRAYQRMISPFLPQACIYEPSCSEYARLAIKDQGLLRGAVISCGRLLRCHPWGRGGFDPPPARRK